jgi:hypothetical protein
MTVRAGNKLSQLDTGLLVRDNHTFDLDWSVEQQPGGATLSLGLSLRPSGPLEVSYCVVVSLVVVDTPYNPERACNTVRISRLPYFVQHDVERLFSPRSSTKCGICPRLIDLCRMTITTWLKLTFCYCRLICPSPTPTPRPACSRPAPSPVVPPSPGLPSKPI